MIFPQLLALAGCGGSPPEPAAAPWVELPLVDGTFTHAAEPSVAARGGRVVVAAVELQFASADAFDAGEAYGRRVATATSDDGGAHFGAAVDPGLAADTSDPVVRVDGSGRFWLAALDARANLPGTFFGFLAGSTDGAAWATAVATEQGGYQWGDKDWLAVDGDALVVAAESGWFRYRGDGALLAERALTVDGGYDGGFADARGAHFASSQAGVVLRWDGAAAPADELVPPTPSDADSWSKSLGATADGRYFLLRTAKGLGVVLDVWAPGDAAATEVAVGGPASFHPAGALDGEGRLHAAWYDSGGASGVLRYARSRSSDLAAGFGDPIVVDDAACPGGGWRPARMPNDRRRLREYIDLAVDGRRAHVAWTHAPAPPARVRAAYLDF